MALGHRRGAATWRGEAVRDSGGASRQRGKGATAAKARCGHDGARLGHRQERLGDDGDVSVADCEMGIRSGQHDTVI